MACEYTYTDKSGKRQTVDEPTIIARYAAGELTHLYPKGWTAPKTLNVSDKNALNTLSIGETIPIRRAVEKAKTPAAKAKALEVSKEYGRGIFKDSMQFLRKHGYRILGQYGVADLAGDLTTENGENKLRTIVDWVSKKDAEPKARLGQMQKEIDGFGPGSSQLNAVMLNATTASYDPKTTPKTDEQRAIQKEYLALDPKEKKMFDYFQKKLEDLYKREVKAVMEWSKSAGINVSQYIPNKLDMYFSLGREGKFVVTAYETVNGKEEVVGLIRNNDSKTIEERRKDMIAQFPNATVTNVMLWQEFTRPVLNASQADIVAKLEKKMTGEGASEAQIKQASNLLKDTLSSFMVRKTENLFKRKNIYGADTDMVRMQYKALVNGEGRIASFKFNPKIDQAIADARKLIETRSRTPGYDSVRAQEGLNAISEGARYVGGNNGLDASANGINTFGYVTTLFANVSSALINITSVGTLSAPDMLARHGAKGLTALTAATKDASLHSLKSIENMPAEMQIVARIMEANNRLHFADAKEILDLSKDNSPLLEKAMYYGGMPMNLAEKMTNMSIALAEYRLQKDKGLSDADMEKAIVTALNNGNPNNTSATKGVYTKTPIGRVAFMLKSYGVNVVGMMLRDISAIGKSNLSAEEKKVAIKRITGVMSSHMVASGLAGLPWLLTQPLAAMLQAVDADDDEQELSPENFLKKRIYEAVGADNANLLFYGTLGAGVASRVSLNDILVRSGVQTGNETLFDTLVNNLTGPGIANISNLAQKSSQFNSDLRTMPAEEAIAKFTKSLPVPAIANIFKGNTIYQTGAAYASDGTKLAEGLTETDAILQAIGLRPSKVAEAAKERGAIKEELGKVDRQRANLMAARRYLYQAVQNGMADPEVLEFWQENVDSFNQRFPGKDIDQKAIDRADKGIDDKRSSLKIKYKNEEEQALAELLLNWAAKEDDEEE
jgi:hypothetical protein